MKTDTDASAPLIPSQKFYKEIHRRSGISYIDTFALRLSGVVNVDALRRSFEELIRRQESLRTKMVMVDGNPVHTVTPAGPFRLKTLEFSDNYGCGVEGEDVARHYIETLALKGCDWTRDELFRVELLRLSQRRHVLVIFIHHFITDGISRLVMFRELWTLYATLVRDQPSSLSPIRAQFSDYRRWLQSTHESWSAHHQAFWRDYLLEAQGIRWPQIPDQSSGITEDTIEVVDVPFTEATSAAVYDLAHRSGVMVSIAAFTVYAAAISQVCAQKDFVMTTTLNGRDHSEFEHVTGYIGHPFYWRVKLNGHETLSELLSHVSQEFYRAMFRKDFGGLWLQHPELMGRTLVQWFPWSADQIKGVPAATESSRLGFDVQLFPFNEPINFPDALDVAVVFSEEGSRITAKVLYRSNVLSQDTIGRFTRALHLADLES